MKNNEKNILNEKEFLKNKYLELAKKEEKINNLIKNFID